jgi:nitric oxide reductase
MRQFVVPPLTRTKRELLDYLAKLVDLRSDFPKSDLISKLVVEQVTPGHISKEDAVAIAFLMLVAGNATMVNMIALVSLEMPNPTVEIVCEASLTDTSPSRASSLSSRTPPSSLSLRPTPRWPLPSSRSSAVSTPAPPWP